MALMLELLQKSEKTYAIDRGFHGFCLKSNTDLCRSAPFLDLIISFSTCFGNISTLLMYINSTFAAFIRQYNHKG